MTDRDAIAVMTRLPEAGRVKTRLQPQLSGREAADLHAALASDLVDELAADARWRLAVYVTPGDRLDEARAWLGPGPELRPQGDGDLGARMHRAVSELSSEGRARVVVVGTDAPRLDQARIADAFAALDDADLVLGPSEDGGYYLIGLTRPAAPLFEGVAWGGERVLAQTLRRAEALGLATTRLPTLADIDTWSDLTEFRGTLLEGEPTDRLTRTRSVMTGIFARRSANEEVSNG